jgi:hypothetical protein
VDSAFAIVFRDSIAPQAALAAVSALNCLTVSDGSGRIV